MFYDPKWFNLISCNYLVIKFCLYLKVQVHVAFDGISFQGRTLINGFEHEKSYEVSLFTLHVILVN